MDLQELENKEDGWKLIVEQEYSLEKIREYVKNSCLADKCSFIDQIDTSDEGVEEFCAGFLAILNDETSLDELTTLLVVACMAYTLEDASVETITSRTGLLDAVVFHTDTLSPQHIHVAAERIWEGLKTPDSRSYVMNLISLFREFSVINSTGKAIAICLAWAILAEISGTDNQMFRFHRFETINSMLDGIDEKYLREDESTQVVYILIQTVGFLVNAIIFGVNDDFIQTGFRSYFKYKRQDLEKLKEWAEQLANFLGASATKPSDYWDLRMSMTEYIKMNIISLLYDKILEMD